MLTEIRTISDVSGLQNFAKDFGDTLKGDEIITLNGPLGAGKTSLARFLIQELTGEDLDVPSPTYTLVQTYDTPKGRLYHLDLYRLENSEEIYELGWEEMAGDGLMLIEWAERIEALIPSRHIALHFSIVGDTQRQLKIVRHD